MEWRRLSLYYFQWVEEKRSQTLLEQKTVFGLILTGSVETTSPNKTILSYFIEVTLNQQLRAFWELKEILKKRIANDEDEYCQELF